MKTSGIPLSSIKNPRARALIEQALRPNANWPDEITMSTPTSFEGLAKQAKAMIRQDSKGLNKTEAAFLDPLDEIAQSGKTAAEHLLALYNGDWHQDVTRVFRDFAY